jgi:hypothetical protein
MRYRLLLAILGVVLALGAPGVRAQESPGLQVHFATGLAFPAEIGDARLVRWNDYGQSAGRPELGFSYHYAIPRRLVATIYVYNLNQRIPDGTDDPVVVAQFQQAWGDIENVARSGRYRELQRLDGPEICRYRTLALRYAAFSAVVAASNQPVFGRVMVTGYRGHFMKVRLDWGRDAIDTASVDRFVEGLTAAMAKP